MPMLDDDIRKLAEQRLHRSLAGLEADIWAGVENLERINRLSRIVQSCQAGVLATGLMISIVAGIQVAGSHNSSDGLNVFSMHDLAPSSRLIGY